MAVAKNPQIVYITGYEIPHFLYMKQRKKRGSDSVTFILGERTFENKANAIRNYKGSTIKNLTYKNKTPTGSKPPKAVMIIAKAGYSDSTRRRHKEKYGYDLPNYFYTSKMSDVDFVVKPLSVKELAADYIEQYNSDFTDVIEENPENYEDNDNVYNIREITIRFIY